MRAKGHDVVAVAEIFPSSGTNSAKEALLSDGSVRGVESIQDRNGNTHYGYDSSHRRMSTADRLGDRGGVAYDPASGKVTSRTDNEGITWRYSYTPQAQDGFAFYNLTRIDYPDGANDQFSYDAGGNVISRTDRAGKIWRYSYNSRGQVLTATNSAGGITGYTYNADAALASAQDPAGNVTGFGYDQVKRLSRIARPDGSTVQFNYDANDPPTITTPDAGWHRL